VAPACAGALILDHSSPYLERVQQELKTGKRRTKSTVEKHRNQKGVFSLFWKVRRYLLRMLVKNSLCEYDRKNNDFVWVYDNELKVNPFASFVAACLYRG